MMLRAVARPRSGRCFCSQPRNLRILRTATNDPFFNLAFEEHLLNEMNEGSPNTMFLWRNKPSVIIGRNQNPYKECHVQRIEERSVELVRRKSGGGAVYQDLGNSIFTFLTPLSDAHTKRVTDGNNKVLLRALEKGFGIRAEASGRNDLVLNGQKISGAAFQRKRLAYLHHGTMLIDVDFTALGGLLNPNKAKLASKGVSSVQARVVNLRTVHAAINHDSWCAAMIDAFAEAHGVAATSVRVEDVDHAALQQTPELAALYDGLRDWNWRFGLTPEFTHQLEKRFDWGTMDVNINSSGGVITDVKVYSDALNTALVDAVEASLKGQQYSRDGVARAAEAAIAFLGSDTPDDVRAQVAQLRDWLQKEI